MHQANLLVRRPRNRAEGDNSKSLKFGAPDKIRTCDLCLRRARAVLFPAIARDCRVFLTKRFFSTILDYPMGPLYLPFAQPCFPVLTPSLPARCCHEAHQTCRRGHRARFNARQMRLGRRGTWIWVADQTNWRAFIHRPISKFKPDQSAHDGKRAPWPSARWPMSLGVLIQPRSGRNNAKHDRSSALRGLRRCR